MRTADVFDLSSERRLGASLDFTPDGAQVLLLNGGSHAEEVFVILRVGARLRSERYCIDAGTSVQIPFMLGSKERARDVRVEITGGPADMLLSEPALVSGPAPGTVRALAGTTAAVLLMFLGIQTVDPGRPEVHMTAPKARAITKKKIVLPNVHARTVLHTIAAAPIHHAAASKPLVVAIAERRPHRVAQRWYPRPVMSALNVPSIVRSGDAVKIAYRAIAEQVRIVASIGPTIVERRILSATHGVIAIHPPPSNREGRVMTVRAYAQNGTRVASLQTMVVLVHSPQ